MSKEDQPKMEMEEDHDSVHSDDDDSEYTYVTDEEEEEPAKKRGWFGFLRREKHVTEDDDYESEEEEGSRNDDGSAASDHQEDNVVPTTTAADNRDDQHSTAASASSEQEEDILDEIDKYDPSNNTPQKSLPSNSQQEQQQEAEEEEEESILMAQAIQRVKQRIQSHGGNIYDALEERDRVLVDTLRGVEDEDVIREVVDTAMEEEEEEERNRKVGQGDDDNDDELVVEENNDCINQEDDINNNNDEKEHFHSPPKIMKRDETTAATNQPSFIPQGVYVEEPSELVSKNNTENSIVNGGSKIDVNLEDQFNGIDQGEEQGEEEEHPQEEEHDEDDDDDDEEEGPTLEEQRSLLSLAAEHDRVDVIKELLSISPNEDVNTSLLCGFSSADNDNPTNLNNNNNNNNNNDGNDDATKTTNTPKNDHTKSQHPTNNVIFVPPPLHAAVAHGSVNAASCLLRMGANPSIRPKVPTPYLSRSYHPSPTSRSRSTTKSSPMEEDRNYKKYHEMSAWELAFGSIVVLKDGDDTIDDDEEIEEEEEEEVTEKRGWFGFGGRGGHHKKDDDEQVEQVTIQQQHQDANGKQRIVRRRQPLNIAPNKLEGIRHAFTAEALRAIGADEVHRLQQLLDSGMDSKMEVAGKSLVSWAIEMEAEGCCELLRGDHHDDDEIKTGSGEDVIVSPPDDSNGGSSPAVVSNSSKDDVHVAQPTNPTNDQSTTVIAQQKPIATIHDERLTGLSPKDILMLIQENENLIPALTTCRDELAEETSACQNILRDVQASGGRGGLSSQTLLDLVHSLKERRRELEDSVKNWRHAWEEREDELDFFWEEVLNDEWREHLVQSGILDDNNDVVSDTTSSSSMTSTTIASGYANASLDDLTRRFCEVDNRVNTLRSSIANLADECARYQAEFERAGMSGALSLTKSLRDELKEMESQLSEAKSGEAMCRRKIELIQERLNNSARDEPVQEHVQNNEYVDDAEEYGYEGDDSHTDGQEQEDVSNLAYDFADKELMEGTAYAEAFVHRGMEREYFQDQYEEEDDRSSASNEGAASYESDHDDRESLENESAVVDKAIEEHIGFVVVNDANEVANEADERNPSEKQEEANVVNNDDDDEETIPSEMQEVEEAAMDAPHLGNGQSHKFETNETENVCADHKGEEHTDLNGVLNAPIRPPDSELDTLKPSDALKSGMSTALVVRQPTGRPGLSLQLWDLIRRIVGLGRTPNYRAQSESTTNIMIV